jgi:hypothetical protein
MTTIHVETKGVDAVLKKFNAMPKQIERASKRAVTKTLKQIETKGRRAIAKAHDIPVKVLRSKSSGYRGRVVKKKFKGGRAGSVWFGHNPIKSGYLGSLKNASAYGGAFARRYFFKSGFIAGTEGGHKGIFKRTSGSRFPIKEETVALPLAKSILRHTAKESVGLFKKNMEQELNYEVNVRGGS